MNTSRSISIARRALALPRHCRTCKAPTSRCTITFTRQYYAHYPRDLSRTASAQSNLSQLGQRRNYATPTSSPSSSIAPEDSRSANEILEDLQDQYATARDEFEIATEETEKKTVYAADDREAARTEFDKLKAMFERASQGPHGEEVTRRVGARLRELENALKGLEIAALEE